MSAEDMKAPSKYGCWWADSGDGLTVVTSRSHAEAATSFMMAELAPCPSQANVLDADKIGAVDLDSGECRFVHVRLVREVVSEYAGSAMAGEAAP